MWLEIKGAGTESATGSSIEFAPNGQLNEVYEIGVIDGALMFHVDGRTRDGDVTTTTTAKLEGEELRGTTVWPDRGEVQWIGLRAPEIAEKDDGSWQEGEPVVLFDGKPKQLAENWGTLHPGRESEWSVNEESYLTNSKGADELVSKQKFWNFLLHVEYRISEGSNSGIGLRGRYEVQIYDTYGKELSTHSAGSLYSRIIPSKNASKPAGEWETYDIRLIGRDVTVVHNDETIIDKQVVEGFTAMATDWQEGEPGPITLQGDHGPVEFRNITVTPLHQ